MKLLKGMHDAESSTFVDAWEVPFLLGHWEVTRLTCPLCMMSVLLNSAFRHSDRAGFFLKLNTIKPRMCFAELSNMTNKPRRHFWKKSSIEPEQQDKLNEIKRQICYLINQYTAREQVTNRQLAFRMQTSLSCTSKVLGYKFNNLTLSQLFKYLVRLYPRSKVLIAGDQIAPTPMRLPAKPSQDHGK